MSGQQYVTYGLGSQPYGNVPPFALDQNFNDATNYPSSNLASTDTRRIRSVSGKAADITSIMDWPNCAPGADCTAPIVSALNSGATGIFVPPNATYYVFSSFTIPTTAGLCLYGAGAGSKLYQNGAGIKFPVNNAINYPGQTIRDLQLIGTVGTGHTLDTSYTGALTLQNLYFTDVPIGFDSLHLDGSPTTYTHDVRAYGIQIYNSTPSGGRAGIYMGPKFGDSELINFIISCNSQVNYGLYLDNGVVTTRFENGHPYGAIINCLFATSTTPGTVISFLNVYFDASAGDLVSITGHNGMRFSLCHFIHVPGGGKHGITLANCVGTQFHCCAFNGSVGSGYMVNETGTSDYTNIDGGQTDTAASFTAPYFNLIGAHSTAQRFSGSGVIPGVKAQSFGFSGTTTGTIGPGVTTFFGVNGAQAAALGGATAYCCPQAGWILNAIVACDTAPGAGQSYSFTVVDAVTGNLQTGSIAGAAAFSVTMTIPFASSPVTAFDQIYIKLVTSAGAASANFRWAVSFIA